MTTYLPSSPTNGDVHKRVTRASAAAAAAAAASGDESTANGHNSSSGISNSARKATDPNGHSCAAGSDKPPSSSSSPAPPQGQHQHPTSRWTWVGYFLLLAITRYTIPNELHTSNPTLRHVWFYGWVTALSTGVGAAPLFFFPDLGKAMLALGNAVAAGMMLSASCSLVWEGATVSEPEGFTAEWWPALAAVLAAPGARVVVGVLTGSPSSSSPRRFWISTRT
ncbi:unnamed protein product [Hapterophycus canaliculatus]